MSYKFGSKSQSRIDTLHPYLQLICNELIRIMDVTILEGHRDEEKQNNFYHAGKSKLKYPNSKHNSHPSLAVDIAPWHKKEPFIRWDDLKSFYYMAGMVKRISYDLHLDITWGRDWDSDNDLDDQTFNDFPHFQIKL